MCKLAARCKSERRAPKLPITYTGRAELATRPSAYSPNFGSQKRIFPKLTRGRQVTKKSPPSIVNISHNNKAVLWSSKVGRDGFEANSINEFVGVASQLKNDWFPDDSNWGPWFRGHAQVHWKLAPKLYRRGATKRSIRIIEDEIRQEFIVRAPGLTGLTEHRPQNSWEWYFTMQHSGAPTRLLDWTEGALLGLYFAVRDSSGSEDASVWVLDPWWLNQRVVGEREVVPPGATAGIWEPDVKRYYRWLPDRYDRGTEIPPESVAVYPSHTARRISTQRSCFTIHGSDSNALDKLSGERGARLVNVRISRTVVREIVDQLAMCGIDEITIFPDLDGLGRFLTTIFDAEPSLGGH